MSQDTNVSGTFIKLPVRGLKLALDTSAFPEPVIQPDFSHEEQWTGRRWLDGKKVYEMIVNAGAFVEGERDVPVNIPGLDRIVRMQGTLETSDGSGFMPLPYVDTMPTNLRSIRFIKSPMAIRLRAAAASPGPAFVFLEYTCTDR